MGYYCTVPQCTSLAGKTKNVKFHRFPRDVTMADKWNLILKRGKPYTKYSKVCSLHFTQADYNVTTMGQWKTLSKDAVPSQNLPRLNPDGTVMVIRKSRTVKHKERKDELNGEKHEKWTPANIGTITADNVANDVHDSQLVYRLQALSALANNISPHHQLQLPVQNPSDTKPKKQDAIMQTDPINTDDDSNQLNNSYSDASEKYENSDYQKNEFSENQEYETDPYTNSDKKYESPKDYTKTSEDYIPQTNEEYNKEAEKYALERKSHNGYEKPIFSKTIQPGYKSETFKPVDFKATDPGYKPESNYKPDYSTVGYEKNEYNRNGYVYQNDYPDSVDILRNQQHNLQILQEHHRVTENQNFFNESHIKQEIDLSNEEEKFIYDRNKEQIADANSMFCPRRDQQRLLDDIQQQVKQEPETNGNYYDPILRPGPELLIAKQNALAAHTQLWQNTARRPFFYSENPHYRVTYEDLTRILQ